jgi:hypothetical protein
MKSRFISLSDYNRNVYNKPNSSIIMKIAITKCPIKKCGEKMQRAYVRKNSCFVPIGWVCLDCPQFLKDN